MMKTTKRLFAVLLAMVMLVCAVPTAVAEGPGDLPATHYFVIPRAEATPGIDWGEVARRLVYTALTGEAVDMTDLQIPLRENYDQIMDLLQNDPRIGDPYDVLMETVMVGTEWYISKFYVNEDSFIANEPKHRYDEQMDVIETLIYDLVNNPALSTADKALIAHDRLCARTAYDYDGYHNHHEAPYDGVSYGPLCLGRGVCAGYASAYNFILDGLGIPSSYIISNNLNHAWSMVRIDGTLYYVDTTWDDPTRDVPGRILHTHFLNNYSTCAALHGVSDFSTLPTSTAYDNYFCKDTQAECLLIGGNIYYLSASRDKLIRRTPGGAETELISIPKLRGSDGSVTSSRMVAVGNEILYLQNREVRSYNVKTGTDRTAYVPTQILDDTNNLMGIRLKDGVVSVYSFTAPIYWTGMTAEAYEQCVTERCESFTYCTHENTVFMRKLPGADCQTLGAEKWICTDCHAPVYKAGLGVLGDHNYIVKMVSDEALAAPANCTTPATYVYSCATCGKVQKHSTRTFSIDTELDPNTHLKTRTVKGTAPSCNATGFTDGEYCDACHKWVSGHEVLPAAHQIELRGAIEPSCEVGGSTGYEYCTRCRTIIKSGTFIDPLGHTDPDANGNCTRCGAHIADPGGNGGNNQPQQHGSCKWCGKDHGGAFGWLVKLFHNLFAAVFGAKYE